MRALKRMWGNHRLIWAVVTILGLWFLFVVIVIVIPLLHETQPTHTNI